MINTRPRAPRSPPTLSRKICCRGTVHLRGEREKILCIPKHLSRMENSAYGSISFVSSSILIVPSIDERTWRLVKTLWQSATSAEMFVPLLYAWTVIYLIHQVVDRQPFGSGVVKSRATRFIRTSSTPLAATQELTDLLETSFHATRRAPPSLKYRRYSSLANLLHRGLSGFIYCCGTRGETRLINAAIRSVESETA